MPFIKLCSVSYKLSREGYIVSIFIISQMKVIEMCQEESETLKEFVYDSLVDAILSTLNKLNLTTEKDSDGKTVVCF